MSVHPDAGRIAEALARRAAARGARGSRWENILTHARLGSTQDEAARLEAGGAPDGTVVIAGEQSGGRGRRTRAWVSPPGTGVYLTTLVRPTRPGAPGARPSSGAVAFSLAAAIAACEAARRMGAAGAVIKWPNDVMAGGRKLAGLLVETRFGGESLRAVLTGCGLNISPPERGFPPELALRATSLRESGARREAFPGVEEAAAELLDALDAWGAQAESAAGSCDLAALVEAFESRSPMSRGGRVTVHQDGRDWVATTEGLGEDGSLRVRPDGGAARELRLSEEITIRGESACCS